LAAGDQAHPMRPRGPPQPLKQVLQKHVGPIEADSWNRAQDKKTMPPKRSAPRNAPRNSL